MRNFRENFRSLVNEEHQQQHSENQKYNGVALLCECAGRLNDGSGLHAMSIERVVSSIQRTARFGLFLFRFGRKLQEKKLNKEENHFQLK
jgi:hypothetical protein